MKASHIGKLFFFMQEYFLLIILRRAGNVLSGIW